jgi:hypothetical protein
MSQELASRHRRQDVCLLVLASGIGLWLGVAAPGTSPTAPPTPTTTVADAPR